MFSWLKKPKANANALEAVQPLYFKDNEAAFRYACDFLSTELNPGAYLPALVQDASEVLGSGTAVKKQKDGNQTALLTVSAKDGGFTVAAATAGPNGPGLMPGDLVVWLVGEQISHLQGKYDDPRMTWGGLIVAKINPEYTAGRGWAIEQTFR